MILVLDHTTADPRSALTPHTPHLLEPEPRLRKCSKATCLRRLGVYVPRSVRTRRMPSP